MAQRLFLFFLAIAWTPYGLYCFAFPGILESFAGIAAQSGTATVELRAMYGGVQIAVGLAALLAFFNPAYAVRALFTQLVVVSGLALTRTLGAVIEGDFSGYTVGALAFEWSIVLLTQWFYRRAVSPATA